LAAWPGKGDSGLRTAGRFHPAPVQAGVNSVDRTGAGLLKDSFNRHTHCAGKQGGSSVRYPKEVVLKDGLEAIILPLQRDDEELLRRFYAGIPEADRWFMRHDVRDPAVIAKWMNDIDIGKVFSIIALSDARIVGHASLHMREFGATRHIGRFRLMVLPEFRYKRLGTWMLLDIIQLAMDKGLSEVRSDFVVGIEEAAIEAARKFDFFKKAVLKHYVKDQQGNRHDLLIMIKRLHKRWGDF